MRTFKTLNSTYEVDYDAQAIRRTEGVNEPTPRFAPDGDWKPYDKMLPWTGGSVLILWPDGKATITSKILDFDDAAH